MRCAFPPCINARVARIPLLAPPLSVRLKLLYALVEITGPESDKNGIRHLP
jgi:hypothetical protein